MEPKQRKKYIVGIYVRLSRDDERGGESVSIDNPRTILCKYAKERGFEIYDKYLDIYVQGNSFSRKD